MSAEAQRLADEDLMPLVARKDADAFESFYDRHGGAAYSLAYRIVGDRGSAQDITQEAFFSIWRSGARYDPTRGSVRAWTLGIVRNRAIDALRRSAQQRRPQFALDGEQLLEHQAGDAQTEGEVLRRDESRRLSQAVRDLPGDQSRVIELAYFGGFSHEEIAEMLGMPLGTVKGRMRLGLEKMRAGLAEGFA